MPRIFKTFLGVGVFGLTMCPAMSAAKVAGPVVPEFWFSEPVPALAAAAGAAEMATDGFAPEPSRTGLARGDAVTALVEHVDGTKRRQWIVLLAGSELSEKDRALPPASGMRLFTSTGNELRYAGSRAALAIHVIGPFNVVPGGTKRDIQAPKDIWSRALVNSEFLQLGFAQGTSTFMRLRDARVARAGTTEDGGEWSAQGTPYPEAEIAAARAMAETIGITAEDERAVFAVAPALQGFFGVAARTPGLSGILVTVVDIPMWSIIARGGKMPNISFDNILPITARTDPQRWGLDAGVDAYETAFVFRLNDRPALVLRLAVVNPRPPLVASAGIVGLVAGRPDGKGPRLMIRLLASRLADETRDTEPATAQR
jgi:hypothetical protein